MCPLVCGGNKQMNNKPAVSQESTTVYHNLPSSLPRPTNSSSCPHITLKEFCKEYNRWFIITYVLSLFVLCNLRGLHLLSPKSAPFSYPILRLTPVPPNPHSSLVCPADNMKEVYYNHYSNHPFPSEYPHFSSV